MAKDYHTEFVNKHCRFMSVVASMGDEREKMLFSLASLVVKV